jgi:hypothetical protein
MSPASDEDLLARQSALQAEAWMVLDELDLAALVAGIGPLLLAGSFVSGLMCWRELDAMVLAGGDFSPQDAMRLAQRLVGQVRERITPAQRIAVLRIKDVWHRRPAYPDQLGGLDIYTAVIEDGIRTPRQFAAWLTSHGLPDT